MSTVAAAWNRKHLLDIESLTAEEIHDLVRYVRTL